MTKYEQTILLECASMLGDVLPKGESQDKTIKLMGVQQMIKELIEKDLNQHPESEVL